MKIDILKNKKMGILTYSHSVGHKERKSGMTPLCKIWMGWQWELTHLKKAEPTRLIIRNKNPVNHSHILNSSQMHNNLYSSKTNFWTNLQK